MIHTLAKVFKNQKENLDVWIHPCPTAKAIIINCPGWRGDIDGYNQKHVRIAEQLVEREVGAVVRMPNVERPEEIYLKELADDMEAVIEYVIGHAFNFVKTPRPEIYLMGTSMGGYAASVAATEFGQVKKVLLIAPSSPFDERFSSYKGDVFIVIGEQDDAVGAKSGKKYYDLASSARSRQLVYIPNCDHQFRGRTNGMILSKAPLWAFAGDTTFPSPDGGLVLYE